MTGWRKFGVIVAASLLPILLFAWGFVFTNYQMFSAPDKLKNALETSGVYQTFVSDVLKHSEQESDGAKIATDQPEVRQAIEKAASPEYLRTQVEGFLDDAYAWIRGESERLAVQIDLSAIKAQVTDELSQLASNRLAAMPVCSGPVDVQSFDPLTAECYPRGLDKNAAVAQVRSEIDQQFKDPIINQDDIKNDQGQSLESQLSAIPKTYDKLVLGMWLGIVLIILCVAAIMLLSKPWRTGLKRVGIIFTTVGAATVALAVISAFLVKQAAESLAEEGSVQASALEIISILADDFRGWWLLFGCTVLILGVAALIALNFIKSGESDQTKPSLEQPHEADDLATPSSKPTSPKKQK